MSTRTPPDSSARSPAFARWLWCVGWVAGAALAALALRHFDWHRAAAVARNASPGWLAAAAAANLSLLAFWALQWKWLLPSGCRVAWRRLWSVVALSWCGMNTLPWMGGHALGLGLLAGWGGVGLEVAVSVVALEQLCEAAGKAVLLILAGAVAPASPPWLHGAAWTLGACAAAALCLLWWLARRHDPASAAPAPPGLLRWARHLEALRRPRVLGAGLSMTAAIKLAEFAAIIAVQRAAGIPLPWTAAVIVLAAVNIATVVAVSPGNLGAYEAAAFLAYRFCGLDAGQALALALLQHLCLLLPLLAAGGAVMTWRAFGGGGPARKPEDGPPATAPR